MPVGAPARAAPRATLEIRKARLRHAVGGDRERMAQQLDFVRPGDIGLGSRSILFIPRMVVERPLPRHGDAGRFAVSVVDSLRCALRRARRPGEARSDDDPLLFEDEADAAAAVIRGWLGGSADRHWWPCVTLGLDPPTWWRRHVLRDAFLLPRVIGRLAQAGAMRNWVTRIDPQDVELAIASLAQAYGLELPLPQPRCLGPPQARLCGADVARVVAVVPELAEMPASGRGRLLVTIALLAHRQPAMVSTAIARRAFVAIAEPTTNLPTNRPIRPAETSQARGQSVPHVSESPRRTPERRSRASEAVPQRIRSDSDEAVRERPKIDAVPDTTPQAPLALEISTRFGGLLFLLNALIALDLYGDFSRPDPGLAGLSPFALLAWLGSRWLGPDFRQDPLHALLLELAGGPEAGARHFAPSPWSVPRTWLAPWPEQRTLRVSLGGGRAMLWHPAGFPAVDLRAACDHSVTTAARRLGFRRTISTARVPRLPRQPRARWIACLALYLRARLARTLGRPDGLAFVCRQRAEIHADEERLIVRFALAEHPLAIRLTGLDRDPGWIPAGGRIVEFAFE